tara:strand:- start:1797 stop:2624 length:828 start_codon:yes stop_codon:yes gene_type:complete
MQEINFKKKLNFWELSTFARNKKFSCEVLIKQAYQKGFLEDENNFLLSKFINHFKNKEKYKSQLFQDIFASFIIGEEFEKTFLEFGATNGLDFSNSYFLENHLNWKGVLSEPSPQWHESLKKNRTNSTIITDCIWTKSNEELDFFVSDIGAYSTLKSYIDNDFKSMPGNTIARKKNGKFIKVKTISLNDLIKSYFQNKSPSYISIDTEGSEFEILKSLDFKKFRPIVFTIEHNFTDYQKKIDDLMISNNYIRIFKRITAFDSWFITKEVFNQINC